MKMIKPVIALSFVSCFALAGCGNKVTYPNLIGDPTDYSKGENWMVKQDNGDKKVDVFFLYPTASTTDCKDQINPITSTVKSLAYVAYDRGPSCFEEYANIFAPYYRQVSAVGIAGCKNGDAFSNTIYNSVVRTDAYAALDYYFEHYNNGKPFILASHSQGSFTMRHVLSEYMALHKDYYSRMIAAYTLGTCYNQEYLTKYTHVKMATGATDTGVVITWNTYTASPTYDEDCFLIYGTNPYCINPLNWKVDDTYAPISENKGSFNVSTHLVDEGATDTKIDLEKHALVCPTAPSKGYAPIVVPAITKIFGTNTLHFDDWNLFYKNIQENAKTRIEAYFAK